MITFSLQSGSNGNCFYVEAGDVRLLIDGGISARKASERLAEHGRSIADVQALLITHDHFDHVCGAGKIHRRFNIPVYTTRETARAAACALGRIREPRYFAAGDTLEFGAVRVHTRRTPHDAADGVVFVIEHEGARLGVLTDLGHPFHGLVDLISSTDAVFLESNYDPELLEQGPYPKQLQARIRGRGGHLSNREAAALVRDCGLFRPKWVALAHLSAQNNRTDLALAAQREAVGLMYPVFVAGRDGVSPVLTVG